jgi:hypothetical protein
MVKVSLQQAVEAHRVVRRRGSHIYQTIGSQMAVRLSALCGGGPPFTPPPYSFLPEAKSTPGPQCGWKDQVNWKIQWPHREWNPRPSGLWYSAWTNYAAAWPRLYKWTVTICHSVSTNASRRVMTDIWLHATKINSTTTNEAIPTDAVPDVTWRRLQCRDSGGRGQMREL